MVLSINDSMYIFSTWQEETPCARLASVQDAAPLAGALLEAVNRDFGGLDKLKAKINAESAAVQACISVGS
jgi:superoxide dismutase